MSTVRMAWAMIVLAMLLSTGCDRPAPAGPAPAPAEVSDEATGHYCGMLLADHAGPKGQVHLASRDGPIWFSSVRDTIAFLRLPEEAKDVVAVYVNDMGRVQDWDQPEAGTWVEARAAWFVVDSAMQGGMGAPEAVPFGTGAAAESFRARHGGRVVRLDAIPDAYVLGPVQLASAMPPAASQDSDAHSNARPDVQPSPGGHAPADADRHRQHPDH